MQTFQLTQFLPLSRLNFPAKILFLTSCCMENQNGSSVHWSCFIVVWNKLQVDSERSFILNFILGLLQTFCLHRFLIFRRRDTLQIQRSDDRTAMSISLEGFSLALKTLTVLSDQKNRLVVWVVGQFFFNY